MKIKIKNLRNLYLDDYYNMKKINVIVGKNSAGKSTFLRFFPLLKQSLERDKSNALLWYGPYVDFGSYNESLRKDEKNISFSLSFNVDYEDIVTKILGFYAFQNYEDMRVRKFNGEMPDSICFNVDVKIVNDRVHEYAINFLNLKILIRREQLNKGLRIFINDNRVLSERKLVERKRSNAQLLIPEEIMVDVADEFAEDGESTVINYLQLDDYSNFRLRNLISMQVPKNTRVDLIQHVRELLKCTFFEIANNPDLRIVDTDIVKDGKTEFPKRLLSNMGKVEFERDYEQELKEHIVLCVLERVLNVVNLELMDYFAHVNYIAPLRATAERYYRNQGLAVNSIDSKGENLAAYIRSLNKDQLNKLNIWLLKYFKFEIQNSKISGHNSVKIKEYNSKYIINLADCGFGYSQILPILIQLWITSNAESKSNNLKHFFLSTKKTVETIVIEQPELHLHPALQARLIDALCDLTEKCNSSSREVCFMLETHSETIVNRIYRNMLLGKINQDDFNISIFEKEEDGTAKITNAEFGDDLRIKNWPTDFFQPED